MAYKRSGVRVPSSPLYYFRKLFLLFFIKKELEKPFYRRKCDFDVEITKDALNFIDKYETLLLFSGDGDYSVLVNDLIEKNKKVILVFGSGCKGKEYNEIKSNLFYTCSVDKLREELEKIDSEK